MKTKNLNSITSAPVLLAGLLMAALLSPALTVQGQTTPTAVAAVSPAPPPGEVWVYPTGVFPDDFYSLWLAVNGAPYASGDLPFPYCSVPDSQPGTRPVFVGKALPNSKWKVVLKARRLEAAGGGAFVEGNYTAFNLGLAAGTQLTKFEPTPPANYLLTTDSDRFSTGFGVLLLMRSVEVQGELLPGDKEQFFGYTPNFDPSANPDTNPAFDAAWLPASYLRGREYDPTLGCGVKSTKSVIYGGNMAFFIYSVNADLTLKDCLLHGQYGSGMSDYTGPNVVRVQNVDICHTYHCHQLGAKNDVGMLSWAIIFQNVLGGGGQKWIEGCHIDQSPTWQEYYFGANSKQGRYEVGSFPGGHAVFVVYQSKANPDDSVTIRRSTLKNCGSNVIVYDTSDLDFLVTDCVIDGGYYPIVQNNASPFPDWRGNCIMIGTPSLDAWGQSPVVEISDNTLIARGWTAWGVSMWGCANGEVTVADNTIVSAQAGLNYAGGVLLRPYWTAGSNRNKVLSNTICGTGVWAIKVEAYSIPCEENLFIDNVLSDFSAQPYGAVFFGPLANDNFFSGDVGAGIYDLGTGNVVEE